MMEEVERCLAKKAPSLRVFDSEAVLARVEKHGDLFADVLTLKQKLPRLGRGALRAVESLRWSYSPRSM